MESLNPTLIWAALVLLSFAAIPRRYWYVRLPRFSGGCWCGSTVSSSATGRTCSDWLWPA